MIEYRAFLNTDPPLLVDFWNRLEKVDGLVTEVDCTVLEQYIFAKQYFDSAGMIIAVDDGKIIGFAHAGFAPDSAMEGLDRTHGVISLLRIDPRLNDPRVSQTLLQMSTDYCRSNGATEIHAGSDFPHSPFYVGFYGGSRHPGVMKEDASALAAFKEFGFVAHDQIIVMELPLEKLTTVMGRQQMSVRRNFLINATNDPLEQSWWECCTLGGTDRERFTAVNKRSKVLVGSVSYWDMKPMSAARQEKSRGLYNLSISEDLRRGGIATYLVGESLKHLAKSGVAVVEAQTRQSDAASRALFQKLGFVETKTATLMRLDFE